MSTAAIRKKLRKILCALLEIDNVSGDVFFDAGWIFFLPTGLKKSADEEFRTGTSIVELKTYTNICSMAEYIVLLQS